LISIGRDGKTGIIKKRLPNPEKPAEAIDAVVKVVYGAADCRRLGPGLQREADRMRQDEGDPLFLQLLFEDADATRCPRWDGLVDCVVWSSACLE